MLTRGSVEGRGEMQGCVDTVYTVIFIFDGVFFCDKYTKILLIRRGRIGNLFLT